MNQLQSAPGTNPIPLGMGGSGEQGLLVQAVKTPCFSLFQQVKLPMVEPHPAASFALVKEHHPAIVGLCINLFEVAVAVGADESCIYHAIVIPYVK